MRTILANFVVGLSLTTVTWGQGRVDVKVTPAMREYCHIIRFPQGWKLPMFVPGLSYNQPIFYRNDSSSDYEFRISGLLGTTFLVAGTGELGNRYYTLNKYEVDLSDPKFAAHAASDDAWEKGTTIPMSRKEVMAGLIQLGNGIPFTFRGRLFEKSGKNWSISNS
jgi:hypothetical protein